MERCNRPPMMRLPFPTPLLPYTTPTSTPTPHHKFTFSHPHTSHLRRHPQRQVCTHTCAIEAQPQAHHNHTPARGMCARARVCARGRTCGSNYIVKLFEALRILLVAPCKQHLTQMARTQIQELAVVTCGSLKQPWIPREVLLVGSRKFVALHGDEYKLAAYLGTVPQDADKKHAASQSGLQGSLRTDESGWTHAHPDFPMG